MIKKFLVVADVDSNFTSDTLCGCIGDFLDNKYDGTYITVDVTDYEEERNCTVYCNQSDSY